MAATPVRNPQRLKSAVRAMAPSSPYATLATASPTTTGQAVTTKTITRASIALSLQQETGLPQRECAELLETVLGEVSDSLINGETVKISSFGSFSVRQKNQRIGRNPKTLEDVMIAARRIVTFRPSAKLR
jgi:integration host factor subunit alpha